MKTDYKKLTGFEAAIVLMIAAGFLIIGVEAYSGLTQKSQAAIGQAIAILDMHESVKEEVADIQMFTDLMISVYDEMNEALIDTVAIDDEFKQLVAITNVGIQKTVAYANSLDHVSTALASVSSGNVLGVSTSQEQSACGDSAEVSSNTDQNSVLDVAYTFNLPELPDLTLLAKLSIN